jgi:hypothetical protein
MFNYDVVAERLRNGLQHRLYGFNSRPRLWSLRGRGGGVATQPSAKWCTWVRFPSAPLEKESSVISKQFSALKDCET